MNRYECSSSDANESERFFDLLRIQSSVNEGNSERENQRNEINRIFDDENTHKMFYNKLTSMIKHKQTAATRTTTTTMKKKCK